MLDKKPVYTVKILVSEQIAFAAVFFFGQVFVFCRLINKSAVGMVCINNVQITYSDQIYKSF